MIDKNIRNVAVFTGLTLVMALGLNFCFAGFGLLKMDATYMEAAKHIYDMSLPIGLILSGIIAPLVEELVYRGILFNGIKRLVKPFYAGVISSILFAYGHAGLLQAVYAFIIGLVFAYAYHHTKRFWVPVMMHSVINIVVYLLSKAEVFKENTTLAIIGLACAVFSGLVLYFKKVRF